MIPSLVIGIAGPDGSGKGTAAQIISLLFPGEASAVSSGRLVKKTLQEYGVSDPDDRVAQSEGFSRIKKERGERWLHSLVQEEWERSGKPVWIFDGVRMPWDVEWIKSFPQWIIFYLDTPPQVSYERIVKRAESGDPTAKKGEEKITQEEFLRRKSYEPASFVEQIKNADGVTVLENDGTPETLGKQIAQALLKGGALSEKDVNARKQELEKFYKTFPVSRS